MSAVLRSLSVLAVLLASMACGPTPLNPDCNDAPFGAGGFGGAGGGSGGAGGGVPLRVPGQEVTVLLELTAPPRCLSALSRVDTEVFDPEGAAIAHTSTLVVAAGSAPAATVRFTPAVAGRYFVRARFRAQAGVEQRFVDVTESVAAVLLDELPSGECERVELLASRAVLCATKTELVVRRAGAQVQRLNVAVGAWLVAGAAVWIDDGLGLRRLMDRGAGPLVEGPARGARIAFATAVFGTEDTVMSLQVSQQGRTVLLRQTMVGEALSETPIELPLGAPTATPVGGVLVAPDLVALMGVDSEVCLLRLPASAPWVAEQVRCERPSDAIVGVAGGRFWMHRVFDDSFTSLRTQRSETTTERFERLEGATTQGVNGFAASALGLPAYRFGFGLQLRLLPRLTPSLRTVLVNFPEAVDGPFMVRDDTIATRSADQRRELFFSW